MNRRFLFTIIFVIATLKLDAQTLYACNVNDEQVKKAIDLYSKEMYRSALEKLNAANASNVLVDDDAQFVAAMSALYNGQNDADALLTKIINSTPKNIHHSEALFGYGRYLYDKNKFKDAAAIFKQVEPSSIPDSEKAEYYFKTGYCYYKAGKKDEAINCFRKIKDQKNKYADAALYYYSHVEYEKGNYITAKQGFERLKTNPNYSNVVPYYTLQIAFIQKDYDKVIADGENFLTVSSESRFGEISRLLAEAYYQKGNLKKAKEYFDRYEKSAGKLSREDHYLKAFMAYKEEDYAAAVKDFLVASGNARDSLAQIADYHLGDAYLQTGSKSDALNAFKRVSVLTFNKNIQQDGFYNYAKLSLELKNDDAPMANYLEKYPEAVNNAELAIYRAESFAKKGKYTDALKVLQAVSNPTAAEKDAIQRLSFMSGLEMFKKEDYYGAIKMFDFSLSNAGYNNSVSALTGYWKANAAYMVGNYAPATTLFKNFVNSAGSFKLQEYNIAHYNLGYCYFKQQNYDQALQWFRKYISFEANSSRKSMYLGDCYNRIGDCYFKKRNYQLASDNYNTAEALGLSNPDYSALQRGISLGFTSGTESKITTLKHLPRAYPNSKFIPAAYYELGRTYQQQMKFDDAISFFQSVVSKYPTSSFYGKSLNALGLIEFNKGNNDRALSYYQQVVNKSPNSPDAQDALAGIKDIYLEQNRMDEYFAYTGKIGKGVSSPFEKDSLTFAAAERLYQSGDCEKAQPAMLKYVSEYSRGAFLVAANFYIADCAMKQGDNTEALKGYTFVARQPENDFTEAAWSGVARANYNLKNYKDAAVAFEQLKSFTQTPAGKLDAEIGCMRANSVAGDNQKAAVSAKIIAVSDGVSDDLKREANIIIGRDYQESGDYKTAIDILKPLAKDLNQAIDAEAKYRLIASYFASNKDKEAEEEVFSFSESKSRQQYWVAKSFIILGEIFAKRKEKVQAEETFKSVINGYPDKEDGVVDEAQQKLDELAK